MGVFFVFLSQVTFGYQHGVSGSWSAAGGDNSGAWSGTSRIFVHSIGAYLVEHASSLSSFTKLIWKCLDYILQDTAPCRIKQHLHFFSLHCRHSGKRSSVIASKYVDLECGKEAFFSASLSGF